ncbi:unnamed protein product [Mytilus edulis]|uniref:Uncharacterized protein n=1 Tax=Mytilus edulis TaxID=6550 RepID=A0A8S3Q4H8_MYTED|nr:unnamed protein product [Mytilus edulis]
MSDFGEIVNKEKLDNYVSVQLGLRYMVNGLQDYVTKQLHSKQTELKQKCALVHCTLNCSSIFGESTKKWCATCKYWKSELLNLYEQCHSPYPFRIKWNKINSISFPQSLEEIAKVFIKDFHAVRHSVLLDLGALMSLIRNATLFDISSQTIDEILHIRNNCCAHNYLVELHEAERNICLDVFIRFLKIPEIICTDSGKNALNRIETLHQSHGLPERILQQPDGRRALEEIRNEHHNGDMDQNSIYSDENLQERLDEITKILNERRKYHFYLGPSPKTMKHSVIQLIFLICFTYWYLSSTPSKESLQGTY